MTKNNVRCATILVGLAVAIVGSHPAAAAEPGFYIGGHVGQSTKDAPRSFYELFNDDIQTFAFFSRTEQTTSFDDSDIAYGLVIGYRLTPHIALEAGYENFGTVTYESRATGNFPLETGTTAVTIESETTGFILTALGVLPLSRDWELFARAGALFADNKIRIDVSSQGQQFLPPLGDFSGSDSSGSTNLYAGLGLSRRFFDIYDLRLEYQRAFDVGAESVGGKGDLDTALLGLMVTF